MNICFLLLLPLSRTVLIANHRCWVHILQWHRTANCQNSKGCPQKSVNSSLSTRPQPMQPVRGAVICKHDRCPVNLVLCFNFSVLSYECQRFSETTSKVFRHSSVLKSACEQHCDSNGESGAS